MQNGEKKKESVNKQEGRQRKRRIGLGEKDGEERKRRGRRKREAQIKRMHGSGGLWWKLGDRGR